MIDSPGLAGRLLGLLRGKGLSQKALAKQADVSRQTITTVLREEQISEAVAQKLANALDVSVGILMGTERDAITASGTSSIRFSGTGSSTIRPANRVSETAAEPYVPNTEHRSELPPRVYEALLGYLGRLERLGLTHEQIARLETTLANTRYAQRFRRQGRPLTEDEQLELLDATWDAIAETLATQGRRP